MRARVPGATLSGVRNARDTVICDTPARRATSSIRRRGPGSAVAVAISALPPLAAGLERCTMFAQSYPAVTAADRCGCAMLDRTADLGSLTQTRQSIDS